MINNWKGVGGIINNSRCQELTVSRKPPLAFIRFQYVLHTCAIASVVPCLFPCTVPQILVTGLSDRMGCGAFCFVFPHSVFTVLTS